jgi:excisionase family DNA binding protein
MYLSVQGAALRLGVSPHTIRRWTESGFLQCTRTSGGHRRIKQEDIDELAHLIGGRNHLAARLACERQLEHLVDATLLIAGEPDSLPFGELARHVGTLLDGHRCVISALSPAQDTLVVVGAWDSSGKSPGPAAAETARRPVVGTSFGDGQVVTVNVGDQRAEPAEVAVLRRNGDKSLILMPALSAGRPVGLVEVLDHQRERRLSRQEVRLAEAAAAQVALALRGASAGAGLRRRDDDLELVRRAVVVIADGHAALASGPAAPAVLNAGAALALRALDGITCVVSRGSQSAGATDAGAAARYGAEGGGTARVLTAAAVTAQGEPLTLTLTLGRPPAGGETEVLTLIATLTAGALAGLPPG